MTENHNDQVKLIKIHSKPKKGYKLGTTSATWKKIKLATYGSGKDNFGEDATIVRTDNCGNVLILFPKECILEAWQWSPLDKSTNVNDGGDVMFLAFQRELSPGIFPLDFELREPKLVNFFYVLENTILVQFEDTNRVKFATYNLKDGYIRSLAALPQIMFKKSAQGSLRTADGDLEINSKFPTFDVKSNGDYIIISNDEGYLVIYQFEPINLKYIPLPHLPKIFKESCQPLINKYNFQSQDFMVFKTSCFDANPIFDIVGNWLVYSPTKYEYRHLKALVEYGNLSNSSSTSQVSSSNSSTVSNSTVTSNAGIANGGINSISTMATPISNNKSKKSKKKKKTTLLTQVKLPPPGPLLNQVISTISNTAIDGICKFSELSSNVVKLYYNGKDSSTQHTATLNELTKSITKSIYSTAASTITSKPDNNQLVKVIDLKNDKVMGIFKPPGGVSNVSLSPYDLQLVHSNLRGDLIFMWDLYKLPLEVSLIGKFIRGKTSAKIKDIFWFINNSTSQNSPTAKGNNYGFGCLTKSTGSIHWFNVNYLSGSLNSNLPNSLGKTHKLISNGSKHDHKHSLSKDTSSFVSPRSSSSDDFSDDWILSSMKAIKFLTLPDKSNSMNSSCSPNAVNQLAIIDSKNQLRLISPLNGLSLFRYQLPNTPVSKEFVPVYNRVFGLTRTAMVPTFNPNLAILNELNGTKKKTVLINPLSRTEIETCGPYSNLYRNKNIEFSTFDYHHEGDLKEFLYNYEMFGNEISHKVIHFGNKGEVNQKNEVIDTGIILDQEVSEEEIDDVETVIGDESVSKKQN